MSAAHGIRLRDLSVVYHHATALQAVTGALPAGSMTAIVGPNGAGKSTLLKAIVGEIATAHGAVELGGLPRHAIAYLPQSADIDRRFPLTVADVALLGLWREIGPFRRVTPKQQDRMRAALATLGLEGLETRQIGALSTGQFQRVLFARLLLQSADVILLDEPFAAIDERTIEDLLDLVQGWHRAGRTIVAVLHDLAQVRRYFPSTLLLARSPVDWGATDRVLSAPNLARARGLAGRWDATAAVAPELATP